MRHIVLLLVLLSSSLHGQENFNLELLSRLDLNDTGNDIWGYVDEDGTEYAIMGTVNATHIISLADPSNPEVVAVVPGTNSTWRDMKTWKEYLYVTTDAGADGLLIVDLSNLPDTVTHKFWQPVLEINDDSLILERCHNIFIDELGFAYITGCNVMSARGDRGAIFLDLNDDPWNPEYVNAITRAYAHDIYVRDNILYASEIYRGELALYDVSDKMDPVFINSIGTSFDFTHNAWPSDDGNFVFTTDERGNAFLDAFDISDHNNIRFLDRYRPVETENLGVVPHNTHYHNGFLVTSWYTDGVVIVDANNPNNMVKVGSYDTSLDPDGGTQGCWGAYPFLPSGIVLASDRQTGLYVFQPHYQRPSYLVGHVTDSETGVPINGVTVRIISQQENASETNATGAYKTGIAFEGDFKVIFSHPDYKSIEVDASLFTGETTILNAQLIPPQEININIQVVDIVTKESIPGAQLKIFNEERDNFGASDSTGLYQTIVFDENYSIVVGAWGYLHNSVMDIDPLQQTDYTIELHPGYQDDFIFDLGWEVSGNAETGQWVRDVPIGTVDNDDPTLLANVDMDISGDFGELCYMTGNGGGSAGTDDVDNGTTILTSPIIYESNNPILNYWIWFYEAGGQGDPFDDTLFVKVSNGEEEFILDSYTENTSGWTVIVVKPINVPFDLTNGYTVSFEVSDQVGTGHLVEAGVDEFQVMSSPLSIETVDESEILVYPNPFHDLLYIVTPEDSFRKVSIYDINGRRVFEDDVKSSSQEISVGLVSGIYILELEGDKNQFIRRLLIKD